MALPPHLHQGEAHEQQRQRIRNCFPDGHPKLGAGAAFPGERRQLEAVAQEVPQSGAGFDHEGAFGGTEHMGSVTEAGDLGVLASIDLIYDLPGNTGKNRLVKLTAEIQFFALQPDRKAGKRGHSRRADQLVIPEIAVFRHTGDAFPQNIIPGTLVCGLAGLPALHSRLFKRGTLVEGITTGISGVRLLIAKQKIFQCHVYLPSAADPAL